MNEEQPSPPSPRLSRSDIYYLLFRHKWKILLIWTVGLTAAAIVWARWPVLYRSEAKLFIRYILENKSVGPDASDSSIKSPNQDGSGIINSEVEILTSYDLILQAVDSVGPGRILANVGGGTNRHAAAGLIQKGLTVTVPRQTAVVRVVLEHPDRAIVQPVLNQLVTSYRLRHAEVHQAAGTMDEFFTRQTDERKNQLNQTLEELRKLKNEMGMLSLDEAKRAYAARLVKIQDELMNAEAQLAEYRLVAGAATNVPAANPVAGIEAPAASPEVVAEYRRVCIWLESLQRRELELQSIFTPNADRMQTLRENIKENEKQRALLEAQYPNLIRQAAPRTSEEALKVRTLEFKINTAKHQLTQVRNEITRLNGMEGPILELERKRDVQEQNLRYFSANLERARFDEALGAGRVSNISLIQAPSPPGRAVSKLLKVLLILLGGSLAGGIMTAFAIELFLDHSLKRPVEIEARLGLPFFFSFPRAKLNGTHRLALPGQAMRLLLSRNDANGNGAAGKPDGTASAASAEAAPWKHDHSLKPYFEALRDRLLMDFEIKDLKHKPKLVAVTGCGDSSGVSTIAGGLAASLSETGDGNVLLVDMNYTGGSAHYFHRGQLECGLDEALTAETRATAMVQDNLYVVTETPANNKVPQILHKRFSNLLPRLRASDYDYIIFDMPPVSQISPTTRVARFMDMIFVVAESERTDRDAVKRACATLAESQANVSVILNKTKSYVPRFLQSDS